MNYLTISTSGEADCLSVGGARAVLGHLACKNPVKLP